MAIRFAIGLLFIILAAHAVMGYLTAQTEYHVSQLPASCWNMGS